MLYLCLENYYMHEEDGGELAFKKGEIYDFEKTLFEKDDYFNEDCEYVTQKDHQGHVHYMEKSDIEKYFKVDEKPSTKLLYGRKKV